MKNLWLGICLLILGYGSIALSQTNAPAKMPAAAPSEPLIVDVHSSPYRAVIWYRTNIGDQRFDMRDATPLDMISMAFDREDQAILGGPSWIDFDRFDVAAKVVSLKATHATATTNPTDGKNPYDEIRPVLKQILTERFHLAYHLADRPLPGYVITLGKDGAKLSTAQDPAAPNNCHVDQDKATPGLHILTCTSETVAQFFAAYGGIFPHPAVDHTGLTKAYDFTLKLAFGQVHTEEDQTRAFSDALKQQLGLVASPGDVPQPAIFVDHIDHTPTANAADVAKLIPPPRDLEFEVATIKPAADDEPQQQIRPNGSQILFSNWPLQALLVEAWQLPTGAWIGNRPDWLNQVRYTIMVKLPTDIEARNVFQDHDLIDRMLDKLLVDRFQIKYHWGEQTQQDAYVLLPGTPKMKKADPTERTSCGFGPAEGEKDVRSAQDSPFDRQFHCQNVTMDQFADLAESLASSEIKNRVPNKTELAGSYDLSLYYTTGRKLRSDAKAATEAAKQAGDASVAPGQGVSVEDAFKKQLGLRLERAPMTQQAIILDHIEKTPTDN
jgi:uncharacterized protein (TIGR03435 family)